MSPELVVIWSGGELLPDRPERTMLPVMRDYWADLADLRELRASRPINAEGRICACGCGTVLPKRARRRGKLPMFAHGHHRKGEGFTVEGEGQNMKWYAWFIIGAISASLPWMLITVDLLDKQDRTRQRDVWRSAANRKQRNEWGL